MEDTVEGIGGRREEKEGRKEGKKEGMKEGSNKELERRN